MAWIDAHRRNAPHRRRRATDGAFAGRGESQDNYALYFFEDCGSSGMDDAPRTPRVYEAGRHYDWVDLSSQMALSFDSLARIHGALGDITRSRHWAARAGELGALINNELWCERTRFYHDRMLPANLVANKTVAGFWPLLAGFCPPDRVAALADHLLNPATFGRPTPVPSLAADDPNYTPEGVYWCGGVWAPTNYMIVSGLRRAGQNDLAHELAARYLGVLARTWEQVEPHTLWESYAPESDRPGTAAYTAKRVKPDFVGWTGIGPIAMLIEDVIGIDLDAAGGYVSWDLRLTEEHGVRRLALPGGGRADFLCASRGDPAAPAHLDICADRPLAVALRCAGRAHTERVTPGRPCRLTI
jgi:hypothetical protein